MKGNQDANRAINGANRGAAMQFVENKHDAGEGLSMSMTGERGPMRLRPARPTGPGSAIEPGRRRLVGAAVALPLAFGASVSLPALATLPASTPAPSAGRVRPGDAGWPDDAAWQELNAAVGGALIKVASPFAACRAQPAALACEALFASPANPWALGDDVALTQTFGWVGAWASSPSVYAVAARHAADVVAAVNFARERRVRLVVKGGGHSYQGTSNAADSLLLWTRHMKDVALQEAFVPACAQPSQSMRVAGVECPRSDRAQVDPG